jgi:hypothetical protein
MATESNNSVQRIISRESVENEGFANMEVMQNCVVAEIETGRLKQLERL